jgi:hypothetical protein
LDEARGSRSTDRDLGLFSCRLAARAELEDRARSEIDDLLRRYGEAWDTAATSAWTLTFLGREPARALELSGIAVACQPHLPAAWIEHGRILARWAQPREAAEAFATAWELLTRGDGYDLAAPAALDLADLHLRLGDHETAGLWARRALAAADSLRGTDPVRSELWWRQAFDVLAGRARELSRPSAPAQGAAGLFEAEARWERVAQLSEPAFG